MALPQSLRILVFQDLPGAWVARALEHDIAAEARTIDAAVAAVVRIARAHVDFDRRHNREPLSTFRAAPHAFWKAFAEGHPVVTELPSPPANASATMRIVTAIASERPSLHRWPPHMSRAVLTPSLPRAT